MPTGNGWLVRSSSVAPVTHLQMADRFAVHHAQPAPSSSSSPQHGRGFSSDTAGLESSSNPWLAPQPAADEVLRQLSDSISRLTPHLVDALSQLQAQLWAEAQHGGGGGGGGGGLDLEAAFELLDVDGSGVLEVNEFPVALEPLGIAQDFDLDDAEMRALGAILDVNGDDYIDEIDFAASLRALQTYFGGAASPDGHADAGTMGTSFGKTMRQDLGMTAGTAAGTGADFGRPADDAPIYDQANSNRPATTKNDRTAAAAAAAATRPQNPNRSMSSPSDGGNWWDQTGGGGGGGGGGPQSTHSDRRGGSVAGAPGPIQLHPAALGVGEGKVVQRPLQTRSMARCPIQYVDGPGTL